MKTIMPASSSSPLSIEQLSQKHLFSTSEDSQRLLRITSTETIGDAINTILYQNSEHSLQQTLAPFLRKAALNHLQTSEHWSYFREDYAFVNSISESFMLKLAANERALTQYKNEYLKGIGITPTRNLDSDKEQKALALIKDTLEEKELSLADSSLKKYIVANRQYQQATNQVSLLRNKLLKGKFGVEVTPDMCDRDDVKQELARIEPILKKEKERLLKPLEPFIQERFNEYIKRYSKDRVWGTYIEAICLAQLFNVSLTITVNNKTTEHYNAGKDRPTVALQCTSNFSHWFIHQYSDTIGDGNCLFNAFAKSLRVIAKEESSLEQSMQVTPLFEDSETPQLIQELTPEGEELLLNVQEESHLESQPATKPVPQRNHDEDVLKERKQLAHDEEIRIQRALRSLQTKIDAIDSIHSADNCGLAKSLLSRLRIATKQYLRDLIDVKKTIPNTQKRFHKACNRLIKDAMPDLERDLSWGDYLTNLLKTLVNAIIKVASLGNASTFFKPVSPESMAAVKETETDLLKTNSELDPHSQSPRDSRKI